MAKIDDWKKAAPNTLKIDWAAVEKELGFALHDNIKDLYSRITSKKDIKGEMKFDPKAFVKEYVNREDWLEDSNGGFPNCEFELWTLEKTDTDYVCRFFKDAFFGDWTGNTMLRSQRPKAQQDVAPQSVGGGNDFGHHALLGQLFLNIGQLYLTFNNDSGRFEWVDIEYGYFDVYEENPYGIVADGAQEFLGKFEK